MKETDLVKYLRSSFVLSRYVNKKRTSKRAGDSPDCCHEIRNKMTVEYSIGNHGEFIKLVCLENDSLLLMPLLEDEHKLKKTRDFNGLLLSEGIFMLLLEL